MKALLSIIAALVAAQILNAQTPIEKPLAPDTMQTIDYLHVPLETISGDTATLAQYHGQVLLLLNVASKCGNTPQYSGLEAALQEVPATGLQRHRLPRQQFRCAGAGHR